MGCAVLKYTLEKYLNLFVGRWCLPTLGMQRYAVGPLVDLLRPTVDPVHTSSLVLTNFC